MGLPPGPLRANHDAIIRKNINISRVVTTQDLPVRKSSGNRTHQQSTPAQMHDCQNRGRPTHISVDSCIRRRPVPCRLLQFAEAISASPQRSSIGDGGTPRPVVQPGCTCKPQSTARDARSTGLSSLNLCVPLKALAFFKYCYQFRWQGWLFNFRRLRFG